MSERYDFVREEGILLELNSSGRVLVNDLVEQFGVSAVTIRKDLDSLEQRSLLRRVRGGAVVSSAGDEGAFSERLRHDSNAKRALARNAAALVSDGDVIAIDSSTTCYYLAQEILDRRDLMVVTYGMRVASLFMDHSSATVIMPGGVLRRASGSLIGAFANVLEGRGRITMGFFGLATLSTHLGLLELSSEEAATKKSLVSACDSVYGLFTSSKIGGFGLHSFAEPAEISGLFTDEHADDEFVADWAAYGVPVTRVEGTGAILESGQRAVVQAAERAQSSRAAG
ncbi:DeoR/GlpR family DNA-binding transcription regulator [Leifsonia sp. A12D58]|uniref:DeoR/GlpR family DNA-binding transcription regulator n=1 Tax=Leifsonia sp. A12D58 TaxID=3397674 RepID=UPI0039E1DB55